MNRALPNTPTGRRPGRSTRPRAAACTSVLLLSLLALPGARTAEAGGGTEVKVRKGTVVIEGDGAVTRLSAGQEARLTAGKPARVKGTESNRPPRAEPIAVKWEPGQTVIIADTEGILLRPVAAGSEGQSADGRYAARLSAEGELLVADLLQDRQAIRFPDGSWLHRFAKCEMRVDPAGRTTMRMPDGRELASSATAKPDEPELKTAVPPAPTTRWKIGIHLDKTTDGLRVKAVSPGSPAETAGFRPGDEVLSIDGQEAPSLEQIQQRLKKARLAEKIPFRVRREKRTVVLTVMVGAWD